MSWGIGALVEEVARDLDVAVAATSLLTHRSANHIDLALLERLSEAHRRIDYQLRMLGYHLDQMEEQIP